MRVAAVATAATPTVTTAAAALHCPPVNRANISAPTQATSAAKKPWAAPGCEPGGAVAPASTAPIRPAHAPPTIAAPPNTAAGTTVDAVAQRIRQSSSAASASAVPINATATSTASPAETAG